MFAALLLSSALAAEPTLSVDPWAMGPEAVARPYDLRRNPDRRRSKLARTSTGLVIAGGSLVALGIPAGMLAGALGTQTMCPPEAFECMGPVFLGAGVAGLSMITGGALALSGGIGFTVDAVRRGHDRRMELSVGMGPNQLVVAGRF